MAYYLVNRQAQPNGDHEVHQTTCGYLPALGNQDHLGYFSTCQEAVRAARNRGYRQVNGCYWCSYACHTQ
jgi:hypothetical protein